MTMRIAIDSFRGEVPRLTPRALPANASQAAVNAKLVSGDLEAWRQFAQTKVLTAGADVRTIALINGQWMSWTQQVDVARGIIAGDNTYRTYLTAPGLYSTPQWTNYAMATTGAEPYPVATRPLGVPAPDTVPTVAVDVAATEDSNITLTNPGAEVGAITGWTVDSGSLAVVNNGDIVGLDAQAGTRFFSGGSVAASEAHQDVALTPSAVIAGQVLKLEWFQATGAAGSTASMGIEFYDDTATIIGTEQTIPEMAPATALTWERRKLEVAVPDNAVTARLIQHYTRVGAGPALDAYIDSITLNSVDYSNAFDGSSLDGWAVSPSAGTPGSSDTHRSVTVDTAVAWTPAAWRLRGDEMMPWLHRDFSTNQSPAVALKFDYAQTATIEGPLVNLFANDTGTGAALLFSPSGIMVMSCSSWDDGGVVVANLGTPLPAGITYTVSLRAEKSGSAEAVVTIDVADSEGDSMVAGLKTKISVNGPRVGFKGRPGSLDGWVYVANVFITVAAPKPLETVDSTATSYVYRFVNDVGEASAPSLASQVVVRPDGGAVIVTTPTTVPSGTGAYFPGAVTKQIYRAVTGATGTAFIFVTEIPLATANYTDSFDDSDIADNEVLDSEDWDLPPATLQGILALPNGVMAGFFGNQLCLSVSGHPHAWRVQDRHTTDTDIVAIENIDNTIVVATKSRAYTATGNSNDSYTMSMPGATQACTSKEGMVFLDGVGVVFPSPDGWMACAGSAGALVNITEGVFTKKQWQALDPSSIVAVVHDGALFWWSTGQAPDSGYALDVRQNGFGLVALSFHAKAAFADPLTDNLYLVLDAMNEPTEAALPVASTAPSLGSTPFKTIYQFDAHASNLLRFQYRTKLYLPPYPVTLSLAQVHAADFANLVLRVYGNGTLLLTKQITSLREFSLPALAAYDSYELEIVGTSTVRSVQASEDVLELAT